MQSIAATDLKFFAGFLRIFTLSYAAAGFAAAQEFSL
jgi:hypothetical protein